MPVDLRAFELELDNNLRKLNVYYDDLITAAFSVHFTVSSLKKMRSSIT